MKKSFVIVILILSTVFSYSFAQEGMSLMQRSALDETGGKQVVYLETAKWGQDSPFNQQCWTSYGGTTHAKTGCVPTAYAIVMRYHEWPEEGTSQKLYNCQAPTYVELTDRAYDYSKMPLEYDGTWSDEQINEVAKLMSHIGHSFMVSYGAGGTSVSDSQNTDKLQKYFDYSLTNASYQADFTLENWQAKIRESLENGCPVIYAANNSGTGDTRHMFIIDGYTDNGYFHFNFGWNGAGNGWFKLDNIKPYQGDDYSWKNGSEHYAIFNFTPNSVKRTLGVATADASMGKVSVNGCEAAENLESMIYERKSAVLTAVPAVGYSFSHWSKNGVSVSTDMDYKVVVGESGNEYLAHFMQAESDTPAVEYEVGLSTGYVSGSSDGAKNSTWIHIVTDEKPAPLELKTTSGLTEVYALSGSYNRYYAYAYDCNDKGHGNITYTLSVPEGYHITGYDMAYWVPTSHKGQVTVSNGNESQTPMDTENNILSVTGLDTVSVSFTLSAASAGQQYITIEKFVVWVKKDIVDNGNTSAIEERLEMNSGEKAVFDLQGHKINIITSPGIYIIDGKKVLVK